MKKYIFLFCFFYLHTYSANNKLSEKNDSLLICQRIDSLNSISSIEFDYNNFVQSHVDNYLSKDNKLLSRMLAISEYYFPIFEKYLDKYNLPLELKYLSVVESALNPRARSVSGARGLWQFMYPTGREYDLDVTSYIDERLDPHKSTDAACKYFIKLFDIFGDWNLVLAAYNGGPGYIQRKLISTGKNNFWELQPYLRRETRNYVPKFMAITYLMNYHKEYNIVPDSIRIIRSELDTLSINYQINFTTLSEITCLSKEEISQYNPAYKNEVFPKNSILNLPPTVIKDYLLNYESYKLFSDAVERKEILIDETRFVYLVESGDYLGKIASNFKLKVFQIQKWNNLKSTKLGIGDKLILYVSDSVFKKINILEPSNSSYIVQKGDTLWDIARMYEGITVSKIKKLNNLKTNSLKPGLKLLIPKA